MKPVLLASSSPRRRALLEQIGIDFEVVGADVDETPLPDEPADAYVERLARAKARAGFRAPSVTLGADTTVVLDDEILGKPCGQKEAEAMLRRLAGQTHEVVTGVAAYDGERLESLTVSSLVQFGDIPQEVASLYWQTGEPADKAGGYGIQGIGGIFAERIEGSFSAIVGLPLRETEALLRLFNIDTWSMRIDGRRTPD